jgi:NADP-dependent 3-hydroxy acid dehydrogenase YdfG
MADDLYNDAIDSDSIARAITFAIEQPGEVDVNEMVIRPTKQEL